MTDILEGIKLFGGLAGFAALGFKIYEELAAYLKIKVQVKSEDGSYSVQTEIENSSKWSNKKIDNAFLIISPETSDIIATGIRIARKLNLAECIKKTNNFDRFKSEQPIYFDNQFAFIPLQFYYRENIGIGDEKLTYSCSIDMTRLQAGSYSVRFYIYCNKRYHRSTQDLLTIK
jgi:hypothetical protein